jgi:hypothetical protein
MIGRKNCPLGLSTFGFGALQPYGNRRISRTTRKQQTCDVLSTAVAPLWLSAFCLLDAVLVKMPRVCSTTSRASQLDERLFGLPPPAGEFSMRFEGSAINGFVCSMVISYSSGDRYPRRMQSFFVVHLLNEIGKLFEDVIVGFIVRQMEFLYFNVLKNNSM